MWNSLLRNSNFSVLRGESMIIPLIYSEELPKRVDRRCCLAYALCKAMLLKFALALSIIACKT